MLNQTSEVIQKIKTSFEDSFKDQLQSGCVYATRCEIPNEVNIEELITELVELGFSATFIEDTLTVYKKH